jgi:hypothetical protein
VFGFTELLKDDSALLDVYLFQLESNFVQKLVRAFFQIVDLFSQHAPTFHCHLIMINTDVTPDKFVDVVTA